MHARKIIPTLVLFGLIGTVQAQSVDDVVKQHIKAVGGEDVLKGIKTVVIQGARYQEERVETFTLYQKGDKFRSEVKADGDTRVSGYDGKTAWREGETQQMGQGGGPMGGPGGGGDRMGGGPPGGRGGFPGGGRGGDRQGPPGGDGQSGPPSGGAQGRGGQQIVRIESPLYLAMTQGDKFKLKGKVFVDGVEALEIEGTAKDKTVTLYDVDASTGLLLKTSRQMEMRGNKMKMESLFSDYQETDGLMVAHAINNRKESPRGERVTDTVIASLQINGDLDDRLFDKPKN